MSHEWKATTGAMEGDWECPKCQKYARGPWPPGPDTRLWFYDSTSHKLLLCDEIIVYRILIE